MDVFQLEILYVKEKYVLKIVHRLRISVKSVSPMQSLKSCEVRVIMIMSLRVFFLGPTTTNLSMELIPLVRLPKLPNQKLTLPRPSFSAL